MSLHFPGRLATLNCGAPLTLPPRAREEWGREGQRAEETEERGHCLARCQQVGS